MDYFGLGVNVDLPLRYGIIGPALNKDVHCGNGAVGPDRYANASSHVDCLSRSQLYSVPECNGNVTVSPFIHYSLFVIAIDYCMIAARGPTGLQRAVRV